MMGKSQKVYSQKTPYQINDHKGFTLGYYKV